MSNKAFSQLFDLFQASFLAKRNKLSPAQADRTKRISARNGIHLRAADDDDDEDKDDTHPPGQPNDPVCATCKGSGDCVDCGGTGKPKEEKKDDARIRVVKKLSRKKKAELVLEVSRLTSELGGKLGLAPHGETRIAPQSRTPHLNEYGRLVADQKHPGRAGAYLSEHREAILRERGIRVQEEQDASEARLAADVAALNARRAEAFAREAAKVEAVKRLQANIDNIKKL